MEATHDLELRVNLEGKDEKYDGDLKELIGYRSTLGAQPSLSVTRTTACLVSSTTNEAGFDDKCHKYECTRKRDNLVIYYKEKKRARKLSGPDRAHEVCVVDGGGSEHKPVALGGSAIKFDKSTPPGIAASLRRLHQNLGHPRREDLLRHLRLAGCDEDVLKAVKLMTCDVCQRTGGPKIQRPSALPHMLDFGDTLGIDLFYARDIDDVKHTFLSVADYGTTFHQVVRVDGQSADDIEEAFNTLWVVPYGGTEVHRC